MSDEGPRVLAEFADYNSLHAALRLAREHRDISFETLDKLSGMPERYCSKVLSPNGSRKLTMEALGWILSGLGAKCLLVDDEQTLAIARSRMKKRSTAFVRASYTHYSMTARKWAQIAALGRKARWERLDEKQRSEVARKIALARWKKQKKTQKNGKDLDKKTSRGPADSKKLRLRQSKRQLDVQRRPLASR